MRTELNNIKKEFDVKIKEQLASTLLKRSFNDKHIIDN